MHVKQGVPDHGFEILRIERFGDQVRRPLIERSEVLFRISGNKHDRDIFRQVHLSDRVGAVPDITSDANCYLFDFNESKGLKRALRAATAAGPERLDEIERYSRQYAALYGPRVFADTFERIVAEV